MIEQGSHAELLSMEDGVYARLVKIQTQVSKDPNVDKLMHHSESNSESVASSDATSVKKAAGSSNSTEGSTSGGIAVLERDGEKCDGEERDGEEPAEEDSAAKNKGPSLRWLDPEFDSLDVNDGQLFLQRDEDELASPVFLLRTFPATHTDEYISVRCWNKGGDDDELGIIRNLTDWPLEIQTAIRDVLNRRYLIRKIEAIHNIKLDTGFLEYDVETDVGRQQFTSRWTQSKALAFGDHGKLLIDTNDNRYVVADVNELGERDRVKFLQYIYW